MLLRPYTGTCKIWRVLGLNLRRGFLRGVCFCAPTRVHEKFDGFHVSTPGYTQNAPDFTLSNKGTPKTHPILEPNLRRGAFRGVYNTPLHGYMKNLAGFIVLAHGYAQTLPGFKPKPSSRDFSGRMQYAPTRIHEKPGEFHIPAHDMARNPAGFGLCHTTWRETRQVLDFVTRHGAKPGGFWTSPLDIAQNLAGF